MSITSSKNNALKLDAKACERQWYLDFFKRHPNAPHELYPVAFDDWFRGQIELHIIQCFEESLLNLPSVLKKSKKLGWNKKKILSRWWRVFKNKR